MKAKKKHFSIAIVLLLIFGSPYIIFHKKLKKIKNDISIIEKTAYAENEKQKIYWSEKYQSECSLCGTFMYDEKEMEILRDTVVSYGADGSQRLMESNAGTDATYTTKIIILKRKCIVYNSHNKFIV